MRNITVQVFRLLSEALVHELGWASQRTKESCINFIIREYDKMTFIYKTALMLILFYFNAASIFKYNSPFINLSIQNRSAVIKSWQNSKISIKRDFIKLIFTLTLLAYYDSEGVTDKIGIERRVYLQTLSFYSGVVNND